MHKKAIEINQINKINPENYKFLNYSTLNSSSLFLHKTTNNRHKEAQSQKYTPWKKVSFNY